MQENIVVRDYLHKYFVVWKLRTAQGKYEEFGLA